MDDPPDECRRAGTAKRAGAPLDGDAVIGRDYMANVKTSLDRAAVATVVLLLIVLLAVYRSFWLAWCRWPRSGSAS